MIINGVEMKGLAVEHAAGLADVLTRNRAAMAPYEPLRSEAFYTEAGQLARIEGMLEERDGGRLVPYVFVEAGGDAGGGAVVGAMNLGSIALGPLCSGGVGYWIDRDWHGKGLATAGLAEVLRAAREDFGLHRVEAQTLIDNHASIRVLAKNGFTEIGLAPRYLHINGAWRDHRLFQRVLHDEAPSA
ncbi:GNAT family N-acetyltransferase [Streptomyces lavendulae]|uniref:GNAT family N-acetyltransferase n=1 Tax=Streptomyces lavendulae TaxID=1914 RepID=UPI0024A11CB0|nr:GNAT family protein [Streptomyces lavendulae]GLX18248.1 GCN5 family N-acetyltransferase [Streptomyces lavendulae subsp. lavendulae]GLX28826.1 GCN5 family N-acetyltransferase [Streptomyces lavendulae subsp. lavendulae]